MNPDQNNLQNDSSNVPPAQPNQSIPQAVPSQAIAPTPSVPGQAVIPAQAATVPINNPQASSTVGQGVSVGQDSQQQAAIQPVRKENGSKKVLKWISVVVLGIIVLYIGIVLLIFIKDILFGTGHKSAKVTNTTSVATQQVNSQAGFSITRPAGWGNSSPTGTGVVAVYQDPQADSAGNGVAVHPAIVISEAKIGASATLSQMVSEIMSGYSQQSGYSLLTSTPTVVGELPAQLETFTFLLQGTPVTATELIVLKGNTVYAIQAISLSSTWPQHESVIEKALISFKIT